VRDGRAYTVAQCQESGGVIRGVYPLENLWKAVYDSDLIHSGGTLHKFIVSVLLLSKKLGDQSKFWGG